MTTTVQAGTSLSSASGHPRRKPPRAAPRWSSPATPASSRPSHSRRAVTRSSTNLGHRFARAVEVVSARMPSPEEARLRKLAAGTVSLGCCTSTTTPRTARSRLRTTSTSATATSVSTSGQNHQAKGPAEPAVNQDPSSGSGLLGGFSIPAATQRSTICPSSLPQRAVVDGGERLRAAAGRRGGWVTRCGLVRRSFAATPRRRGPCPPARACAAPSRVQRRSARWRQQARQGRQVGAARRPPRWAGR
jgi:hypothetical protein